jgi:TolA-binding protein
LFYFGLIFTSYNKDIKTIQGGGKMKKLLSLLLIILMLVPATAFAKEDPNTNAPQNNTKIEDTAKKQYKEQLKAKKEMLKQLHVKIDALRQENKQLLSSIKPILKGLKQNKDEAAKAKLDLVKSYLETLYNKRTGLKELKDAGKPYWEQFKSNIQNKKYDEALANLDSISGIRTNRLELLTSINTALKEIAGILK